MLTLSTTRNSSLHKTLNLARIKNNCVCNNRSTKCPVHPLPFFHLEMSPRVESVGTLYLTVATWTGQQAAINQTFFFFWHLFLLNPLNCVNMYPQSYNKTCEWQRILLQSNVCPPHHGRANESSPRLFLSCVPRTTTPFNLLSLWSKIQTYFLCNLGHPRWNQLVLLQLTLWHCAVSSQVSHCLSTRLYCNCVRSRCAVSRFFLVASHPSNCTQTTKWEANTSVRLEVVVALRCTIGSRTRV